MCAPGLNHQLAVSVETYCLHFQCQQINPVKLLRPRGLVEAMDKHEMLIFAFAKKLKNKCEQWCAMLNQSYPFLMATMHRQPYQSIAFLLSANRIVYRYSSHKMID